MLSMRFNIHASDYQYAKRNSSGNNDGKTNESKVVVAANKK